MDSFKNPIGGMDFEPVQNWSRFLQPVYKIKLVIMKMYVLKSPSLSNEAI